MSENSKRYSSYKSQPKVCKLFLNFLSNGPHKNAFGIFEILSLWFLMIFFSKISNSPLYHMEKPKTSIIWKRVYVQLLELWPMAKLVLKAERQDPWTSCIDIRLIYVSDELPLCSWLPLMHLSKCLAFHFSLCLWGVFIILYTWCTWQSAQPITETIKYNVASIRYYRQMVDNIYNA